MLSRRIASRYADAIFDLAQKQGAVERWEEELGLLSHTLAMNSQLSELFAHPEIPAARKQELIDRAFKGRLAPEIVALLSMLIERGHEPDFKTIHNLYIKRWNNLRRVLPAKVTSAVPLSAQQAKALTAVLSRRTGATIELSQEVNSALIAGMVITLGDRLIDASASTALEELRASMAGG